MLGFACRRKHAEVVTKAVDDKREELFVVFLSLKRSITSVRLKDEYSIDFLKTKGYQHDHQIHQGMRHSSTFWHR